jgi:hypothetical protein
MQEKRVPGVLQNAVEFQLRAAIFDAKQWLYCSHRIIVVS